LIFVRGDSLGGVWSGKKTLEEKTEKDPPESRRYSRGKAKDMIDLQNASCQ